MTNTPPLLTPNAPTWMRYTLQAAAIYNIVWGAWVVLFPQSFFIWFGLPLLQYPAIWQAVGMIVGCYGIGYWLAAYDPVRHYPVILVGFLGKLFGPIGFIQQAYLGTLPLVFGLHNITNDLIWLIPFALILRFAYQATYTKKSVNASTLHKAAKL
ncbi:alkyl hydroperoxide reductase [Eisenibacter elegans]|uniref:alkyl hydroperoxide reductase n=1 Tax=Eisenibacter elegans TaxID=997 RepID=UPI001B7FC04F|nr:alkyl hydroperoxide reductase [Eisenibacter elegans]